MRTKAKPRYATEAALCAAFIEWVKAEGGKVRYGKRTPVWTPYAETAGWDILLVAEDGTQIGVQAKLKFNMKVLAQTIPEGSWSAWSERGPDHRAVLVPEYDRGSESICAALGIMLFTPSLRTLDGPVAFGPGLSLEHATGWHDWNPKTRCALPEYVPDVVAGDSGPVQLTKWKVGALKVLAVLELQGYITRADFRLIGIDARAWTGPQGWVKPGAEPGQFVRGSADFDQQHPMVYAQVLADMRRTWTLPAAPVQKTIPQDMPEENASCSA